ncbi:preprotein translocase subunit SecE [Patescibacteria group bacterium]|nr:preprotein translocase subunit SecE [Patescibacteria group bacterium]
MKFSLTDNRVVNYIKEAREELGKVVWPSRAELVRHTLIVVGVSLTVALFLGVFDFVFNNVLERLV